MSAAAATPFPAWLKPLLKDVHSISEAKADIVKHGRSLDLSGWYIDSDLRKRRQKLETRILTILKPFQDQMQHHNWVAFVESSTLGHATLQPHIESLYEEMHDIKCEYVKYTDFLSQVKFTSSELEKKEATLEDARQHMKFTEKHLHYLNSDHDDYTARQIRKSMYWDGWK